MGVPIPVRANLVIGAVSAAIPCMILFVYSYLALANEVWRLLEEPVGMIIAFLGGGTYWGLRHAYERILLRNEVELEVYPDRVVLPGVLFGRRDEFVIRRRDVRRVLLETSFPSPGVEPTSLSLDIVPAPHSVRFWRDGLAVDPVYVAEKFRVILGVPVERAEAAFHVPNWAGGVALVVIVGVAAHFIIRSR